MISKEIQSYANGCIYVVLVLLTRWRVAKREYRNGKGQGTYENVNAHNLHFMHCYLHILRRITITGKFPQYCTVNK